MAARSTPGRSNHSTIAAPLLPRRGCAHEVKFGDTRREAHGGVRVFLATSSVLLSAMRRNAVRTLEIGDARTCELEPLVGLGPES